MSADPTYSDSKELEKALRDLDPAPLDEAFIARLEAAADGTITALSPAEIHFENSLRRHVPLALPDDFMERLERVVADVQFAKDEKIVLFPKTAPARSKPAARKRSTPWAAAAAVALIGAATAFFMPGGDSPAGSLAKSAAPGIQRPHQNNSNFVPAGFNTGVDDAIDEGVNWHQGDKPHRVLRVTYLDKSTFKNAEGKTIEVEQPRTEYILVPEKID